MSLWKSIWSVIIALTLSVGLINCGGSSSSTTAALTAAEISVLSGIITSSSTSTESAAIMLSETVAGNALADATVTATISSTGVDCGATTSSSTGTYSISISGDCKTAVNNGRVVVIHATKDITTDTGTTQTVSSAFFNMKDATIDNENLNITPETNAAAAIISSKLIQYSLKPSNLALANDASTEDTAPINTVIIDIVQAAKQLISQLDVKACPVVDHSKTETQSAVYINDLIHLNCADALLASTAIPDEQKTALNDAIATLPEISETFYVGQVVIDTETDTVTNDGFSDNLEFGFPSEFTPSSSNTKAFVPSVVAEISGVIIQSDIDFTEKDIKEWKDVTFIGVNMAHVPGDTFTDVALENVKMAKDKTFKGDITLDKTYDELSFCTAGETSCAAGLEGQVSVSVDCAGVAGGTAVLDACGVCGGDGSTCSDSEVVSGVSDCAGNVGGSATTDNCGVCGGPGKITYYEDTDGDALGDLNNPILACADAVPTGYIDNSDDT